jgi:hypothetical protein
MYNLYLDDVRIPAASFDYTKNKIYTDLEWVIVRSYEEFVKYITANGLPETVSFDHDLADEHYTNDMYKGAEVYNKHYDKFEEKTGYDCVKWLCDYCIDNGKEFPKWYLHTMNPVGKENMKMYILSYLNHFEPEKIQRHENGTLSVKN